VGVGGGSSSGSGSSGSGSNTSTSSSGGKYDVAWQALAATQCLFDCTDSVDFNVLGKAMLDSPPAQIL
jgi:hypothetical protein